MSNKQSAEASESRELRTSETLSIIHRLFLLSSKMLVVSLVFFYCALIEVPAGPIKYLLIHQ